VSFSPQKILALYRGSALYGARGWADSTLFPIYAGSKPIQFTVDSDLVVQQLDTETSVITTLVMNTDYRVEGKNVRLLTGSLGKGKVLGIFLSQPIEQPYRLRLPDPGPPTRRTTMWLRDFDQPARIRHHPAAFSFGEIL
jgi:hypothetical protein